MALPLWFWFRARLCEDGACVEVAQADGDVAVRDSKHREGPMLRFTRAEWAVFLGGAKAGDFDHLA
jgi:hypothetical protein